MATIPENNVGIQDIFDWFVCQEDLKEIKQREMILRLRIFKGLFPTPKEGTNTLPLKALLKAGNFYDDGRVLKASHEVNRDVDVAALTALTPTLQERKYPLSDLVKWKPSLAKSEYNKLTEEEKGFFDQVLIIKPGTPSLEIVLPAAAKKKQEKTT